jgi:NodT family efflux transporter outer membrane factor (OMF) lipoprotein
MATVTRREEVTVETDFPASLTCRCLLVSLALAGALSLESCSAGPDFQRPGISVPEQYRDEASAPRTVASAVPGGESQALHLGQDVSGSWWELFHCAALTALVDAALRDSPTLAAAQAALRAAQERNLAQTGTLLPSVSGALSRSWGPASLSSESLTTQQAENTPYNAQLNLNYTLDLWGGLRRAAEQTRAQEDVQRFQLRATYLSLSAGVVSSAILAASLTAQLDAQQRLIDFERKQLDTVRQQFEAGAATGTDVATQEAQVAQSETLTGPLRLQLAQAQDQIAAYVGHAATQMSIPALELDALTLPTNLPLSLPAALIEQRPDIRAAESVLHAQMAGLGVASAARLPNITLQATAASAAGRLSQLFNPVNGAWAVANQAVQPIFDAGQLLHNQRAQKALVDQAAAQWRQTVVNAFQNVADVLAALQNDALTLQAALAEYVAAQRALFLATEQYRLGGTSYLSVLAAQQASQTSLMTLVRARAARFEDTVALFQALGGGWWNRQEGTASPPRLISSPFP